MTNPNSQKTAKTLFDLRLTLSAARGVLAEDNAIGRPLPGTMTSETLSADALTSGKLLAQPLFHAARQNAMDLMVQTGDRTETELGALAVEIKEAVERACRCLDQHGDAPDNMDRIASSRAVSAAWQLTGAALRIFAVEQSSTLRPSKQ